MQWRKQMLGIIQFYTLLQVHGPWDLMGPHGFSPWEGNTVTCHFYLFLLPLFWPLFDFNIFHYFHLLIFYSILSSSEPFVFPSSVFCPLFIFWFLITSVLHVPSCSPLFHFYYYLPTICPLFLAFPSWLWQLIIPSLVTLWVILLHSLYYTVLHITLSHVA